MFIIPTLTIHLYFLSFHNYTMIRSTVFSLALCIAFASQSRALTYWVDSVSCTGQRSLTLALEETKLMGLRASERLNSNTDTDYQHVYEFLMKRKKSDHAELNQIEGRRA